MVFQIDLELVCVVVSGRLEGRAFEPGPRVLGLAERAHPPPNFADSFQGQGRNAPSRTRFSERLGV